MDFELDQNLSGLVSWNDVLEQLPIQEANLIFGRLSHEDKLSARLVCKAWTAFVDPVVAFRPFLNDGSIDAVTKFGASGKHIRSLTISQFKTAKYPKDGLGFSGVGTLEFIARAYNTKMNPQGPPRVEEGISKKNLVKIFDNYPDIDELFLHSTALREIRTVLPTLRLPCLKGLRIAACDVDICGLERSAEVLTNTFPKLKAINIEFVNTNDNGNFLPLYYEESYRFLANHSDSLDEVILNHDNYMSVRDNINWSRWIKDTLAYNIPDERYTNLLELIDRVNVSKLNLMFTSCEGWPQSPFQLSVRLLLAQTKLTSLRLSNLSLANFNVWRAMPELLRNNSNTLQEVNIVGCFCTSSPFICVGLLMVTDPFDCSPLTYNDQLRIVNLNICGVEISNIECLPRQLETLCLGPSLTLDQIDFIAKNMINLKSLKLLQGAPRSGSQADVPRVTAIVARGILMLPNLINLTLNKPSCSYKTIRKMIAKVSWIEEVPVDRNSEFNPDDPAEGYHDQSNANYFKVKIDLSRKHNPSAI